MKQDDIEKINTLFKFLNDMGRQMTERINKGSREHFKLLVRELYETSTEMRDRLAEEAKKNNLNLKLPDIKFPDVNLPEIKIFNSGNLPEIPKFPDKISVEEGADIIDILALIAKDLKAKNFDFSGIENKLVDLKNKFEVEISRLRKVVPEISKLPMERGRIKVILPNDQVMRTSFGERMTKAVKGIFLGGETNNPIARLANTGGTQINPATEDTLADIKAAVEAKNSIGDGTATVTTAGTRVQLPDVSCKRVFIQAHESNAGTIVVGGSTVVAALSGRRGFALYSTQGEWFNVNNLSLLWIDATANNDKINYFYEE